MTAAERQAIIGEYDLTYLVQCHGDKVYYYDEVFKHWLEIPELRLSAPNATEVRVQDETAKTCRSCSEERQAMDLPVCDALAKFYRE